MQSENRLFDDATKMICKIAKSLCKLTKRIGEIKPQQSQAHQEKEITKVKNKDV